MRKGSNRDEGKLRLALVALLGVLVCAACDHGPTRVEYLDLVTTRSLRANGEPLQTKETFAVDETWVAVTLEPGTAVTSALDLQIDPVLTLSGCLVCADGMQADVGATLGGNIDGGGSRQVRFAIDLDPVGGWWTWEVDLARVENRQAGLRFEVDVPEGCVVRLREATVRQYRAVAPPLPEPPKQVLLISVDTLRYDAIGAFGGSDATPNLDRLAAESESFSRHYAAASWTKPSHASLLTGFYPDTHRAITLEQAMDPGIPTLAERFRDAGLETAALVFDCTWLSPRWGFSKGFDSYHVTRWRAGRQARMAADWVLDHRDEGFFFFLHTFEPHSDFKLLPYEAPGLTRKVIAERFGIDGFGCRGGSCASQFVNGLHHRDVPLEPSDPEILRYCYDEGVRYVDRSLGELFESLRSDGIWDQMLVVVTSDHGEAFGERGEFGHNSLHEEIVRVPLMIKWPGGVSAGEVHDTPRSAVDVAPTLLDFAGLVADELPGEDLHKARSEAAVFTGTLEKAVIVGDDKGILAANSSVRFFDLGIDPGEVTDRAGSDPAKMAAIRQLIQEHRQVSLELFRVFGSDRVADEVILSKRERDRLRAFGYIE